VISHRSAVETIAAACLRRPEYLFLALGSVFGLVFLVLTPPFQVPDEFVHFFRAYEVSEGRLIPTVPEGSSNGAPAAELPAALGEASQRFAAMPFHTETKTTAEEIAAANLDISRERLDTLGTTIHPWMCYAPQVIGIQLARLLDLGVIATLYAGRVFALLSWLIAVFFAVRISPIGKFAFVAVSLLPITVFIAPSLSADSFTYSMVVLAVAYALRCATSEEPLSTTQIAWVLLLSLVVSLLKAPYSLLFLIFLLIPSSHLRAKRAHLPLFFVGLFVCLLVAGSWNLLVQPGATPDRTDVLVSPSLQLAAIRRNPARLLVAVFRSYVSFTGVRLALRVTTFGWNDTNMHAAWAVLAWGTVLRSFAVVENALAKAHTIMKATQWVLLLSVFLMVNVALYISTNAVGSILPIGGLQIRYLVPLVVAAIPLASMRRHLVFRETSNEGLYLAAVAFAVLTASACVLFGRFFQR